MESRIRFCGVRDVGPSTLARCSIRLSTPPSDVARFSALLSNDYQRIALSWSNNLMTVLACTNQSYTTNPAAWFALAQNVSSPWTHQDASNYPVCFYRIAGGAYTSAFDIGKYDVALPGGPATKYLGSPFEWQTPATISNLFRDQLEGGTLAQRDSVIMADGITKYADPWWTGTAWSNVLGAGTGLIVQRSAAHSNATRITFVGMVPTNTIIVSGIDRTAGAVNYLSTLCAATQSVYQSGLTNGVLVPAGTITDWDTLNFESGPVKYKNDGTFTLDKVMQPGEMFGLQYKVTRTPTATNWSRPKPY